MRQKSKNKKDEPITPIAPIIPVQELPVVPETPITIILPTVEEYKPITFQVSEKVQNIALFDTTRYHEDFKPRLFKKGEIIPDEWTDSPDSTKWEYKYNYESGIGDWVRK